LNRRGAEAQRTQRGKRNFSSHLERASPIEDQIGRLTAIATIIAGLTPAIQGIPEAIANFFFVADNITELGLNINSIAGNLTRAYAGLFHSHLARLRINSESNSESRLKTTEKRL
jgi:hypothetical protein